VFAFLYGLFAVVMWIVHWRMRRQGHDGENA
jgi:hypothetical protein